MRASAGLAGDLSEPASSSGRWFSRRHRSPAGAVRRECEAHPGWVLRHHTQDQLPNFRRQFFPTDLFSRLRDQTPVQSKTSAMPANDRLRIDEHQRLLPSQKRRANTQKILSTAPIRGLGCLRFSTASCCRRARFSRSRLRCDCQQRVSRPNHNPTWRNMKDSHSRYCR